MSPYSEFALDDAERERGLILACRAVPWSDAAVSWLESDEIVVHPLRRMTCRVVGLDDATHDIKRVLAEDDFVVVHYHVRRWPGDPGFAVIDIFRCADGMIVEHWQIADIAGMLRQLGATPAVPGASGEESRPAGAGATGGA